MVIRIENPFLRPKPWANAVSERVFQCQRRPATLLHVSLRTIALVLAYAAPALAEPRAYRGAHPIDLEGNWDLEDELHVHEDLPVGLEPFAEVDGALVFLADPIAYGYDGAAWIYRGAHPIPGALGRGYCGIPGEHRHAFAPEGSYRREGAGAYVFTGAMRGGYRVVRPARVAPLHPIAIAPPIVLGPVGTTFFIGDCLHTVVVGLDGVPVAVPLEECIVSAPRPPPAPRPREPARARVESRPMRAPPPRGDRPQR